MKNILKTSLIVLTVFFISFNLSVNASNIFLPSDNNNPPNPPEIEGETNCKIKQEYVYNITITHPDGYRMTELFVMFGDGTNITLEFQGSSCNKGWRSGMMFGIKHTWKKSDDFSIKAKVKDYFREWSDWGTLDVHVLKGKIDITHQLRYLPNIFEFSKSNPRLFTRSEEIILSCL
jgi:hypothetical protein